jgi:AraC family transcriptional regulator
MIDSPRDTLLYGAVGRELLAEIAQAVRTLAKGPGWSVADATCTLGPGDRPFEERHNRFALAVVASGTFEYRGELRAGITRELMTPGALFLGNLDQHFECGHEHAAGDRCVSFGFSPDYFERVAADAGLRGPLGFESLRVPPVRSSAPLVARACNGLAQPDAIAWEELGLELVVTALRESRATAASSRTRPGPAAIARVTEIVRLIDEDPSAAHALSDLAQVAGLSPFHFLRTFQRLTGITPHQYLLRARLRSAARRLVERRGTILDVAFDAGFGDVSNFNHAFRAEFGVNPRAFVAATARHSMPIVK